MASMMQTRRAAAMEEQQKLKNALRELKQLKQQNDQLVREQEDSEEELRAIISKNSQLKAELAELNSAHILVLEERNQLREAVGSFNECIQTYEDALRKISLLEDELSRAQKTIDDLQCQLHSSETGATNNLYDELLASSSATPVLTIDLTCDSPHGSSGKPLPKCDNRVYFNSHKKLKKYIKIGKIIKKNKNLLKIQKAHTKNLTLRKERAHLLNKLESYSSSLTEIIGKYDMDIQNLNDEILNLNNALVNVTRQYEESQKQIGDHLVAADELLALGTYNMARFDSLTSKCQCPRNVSRASQDSNSILLQETMSTSPERCTTITKTKTFMYSDGIGKDMGILLNLHLQGHTVLNCCSPNASLRTIVNSIYDNRNNFDLKTNLVVFVANRGSVNKYDLEKCYNTLEKLNVNKIIIYTFPYCDNLPDQENSYRYKLNNTLYNLCTYNDKFKIIDITKCGKVYYNLKQDRYKLSCRSKRQIAASLSYLFTILAKNLAKPTASIEQCFTSDCKIMDVNPSNFTLN